MPFSTDVNWPQGLLNIINVSRNKNTSLESRYNGPYDRLFNYSVIEGSFSFFLAPQTAPDETSPRDVADSVAYMVVLNQEQRPVLFAEINDDRWVSEPDKRMKADAQIRQRFDQLLHKSAVPRLYGLSLLGTSLRVYCGDRVTDVITPQYVPRPDPDRNLDILSQDGLRKIQEIVAYIKAEADIV